MSEHDIRQDQRNMWIIFGIIIALIGSFASCIVCIMVLNLSIATGFKIHDEIVDQKENPPLKAVPMPELVMPEQKPIAEPHKKKRPDKITPKDIQPKLDVRP